MCYIVENGPGLDVVAVRGNLHVVNAVEEERERFEEDQRGHDPVDPGETPSVEDSVHCREYRWTRYPVLYYRRYPAEYRIRISKARFLISGRIFDPIRGVRPGICTDIRYPSGCSVSGRI